MNSLLSIRTKHAFLTSTFLLALAGQVQAQATETAPAAPEAAPAEPVAPVTAPAPIEAAPAEAPSAVAPAPATVAATTAPAPAPEPAPAPPPAPVVAVAAPVAPAAPAVPPLKVGASFMTRYEARAGALPVIGNRPLNADAIFYRARLSLMPAPVEFGEGMSSTVYFEPQSSGFYLVGGDPLQDIDLNLHQGYLRLQAPCYTLDVGRFEMIYGDHLMIGNVGWNQTGRAFNGGRLHITPSGGTGAWLDLFATLNNEGTALQLDTIPLSDRNIGSLDHYLLGAYAGLGALVGAELDLYLLTKVWLGGTAPGMAGAQSVDPAAQLTFGARVKGAAGALDYRAEAGVQFGARKGGNNPTLQPVSVFAYQADAELGVKPVKGLRLAAQGFIASGDDPETEDTVEAWDQHYPTAHKFLGLTDVFGGRSNVLGGAVHGSLAIGQSLQATVSGHLFTRPETPEGVDGYAGSEVDAGLAYALAPSTSFRGLYGVFLPNQDGSFANDLPQHFVEIELLHTIK